MRWLISTDGTPRSQQAAVFAAKLLNPEQDEVILLGISNKGDEQALGQSLKELEAMLSGIVIKRVVKDGPTAEVIETVAFQENVNITLYGSRGRKGLAKVLFGSVAARLAHDIPSSVLIVRRAPLPIEHILICTTLDRFHLGPIRMGGMLAHITDADVTLLHVMSQIPLSEKAPEDQLQLSAKQAIEQRTREGLGLLRAQQILSEYGVKSETLIRHGLVIDEILEEVVTGNYELVVIGAHGESTGQRWQDLFVEDITNTILLDTRCPVLIVRKSPQNHINETDELSEYEAT